MTRRKEKGVGLPVSRRVSWLGPEFGGSEDRDHLEIDEVAPVGEPGVEGGAVGGLHHLITAGAVGGHPACHVREAGGVGHETAAGAEAFADGGGGAALEAFDDHEEHGRGTRVVVFGFKAKALQHRVAPSFTELMREAKKRGREESGKVRNYQCTPGRSPLPRPRRHRLEADATRLRG